MCKCKNKCDCKPIQLTSGTKGEKGDTGSEGPQGIPGVYQAPALKEVLVVGNETGGTNILVNNADAIQLDNGSLLKKGTYDFQTESIIVSNIANTGTGEIAGVMGWGNPSGTQWSDLNGTYVKTDVAITPSGVGVGDIGMHTPIAGTYNYYLAPFGNSAFNGVAYFLAPGNRCGWGNPSDNSTTDIPVSYWRLCVLSDYPNCYFYNPSTDPYNFPLTGWVAVDSSIPNNEGGGGYSYIANYDGGFDASVTSIINGVGGISRICSVGYEDMWQSGIRYVFDSAGNIREATNCFDIIPNNTFDNTQKFTVDSRWVLDNGDVYKCIDATTSGATWSLVNYGSIPTLQQVLDNNHNLSDGNNFQGSSAGGGNAGIYVNAFGMNAANSNVGDSVNAMGLSAAQSNTGTEVNALGTNAAQNNTGDDINAMGPNAAYNNNGSDVNAFGYESALNNVGNYVNGIGYNAISNNIGNDVNAIGYYAASANEGDYVNAMGDGAAAGNTGGNVIAFGSGSSSANTGNNVIAIGTAAGAGNPLSGMFIIANTELPSYANHAAASAAISPTGIVGNTYIYHNQATDSIGAVRL